MRGETRQADEALGREGAVLFVGVQQPGVDRCLFVKPELLAAPVLIKRKGVPEHKPPLLRRGIHPLRQALTLAVHRHSVQVALFSDPDEPTALLGVQIILLRVTPVLQGD